MSFIYIAPARANIRGTTYIVGIHLESRLLYRRAVWACVSHSKSNSPYERSKKSEEKEWSRQKQLQTQHKRAGVVAVAVAAEISA